MTSKFHTKANLTQALNSIIQQHYSSMAQEEQRIPAAMPGFVSEALHQICYAVAGITNDDLYEPKNWEDIKYYCNEILAVVHEAQQKTQ